MVPYPAMSVARGNHHDRDRSLPTARDPQRPDRAGTVARRAWPRLRCAAKCLVPSCWPASRRPGRGCRSWRSSPMTASPTRARSCASTTRSRSCSPAGVRDTAARRTTTAAPAVSSSPVEGTFQERRFSWDGPQLVVAETTTRPEGRGDSHHARRDPRHDRRRRAG